MFARAIINTRAYLYTYDEQSKSIKYHTPLIKKHVLFIGDKPLAFGFNFGSGAYPVDVLIDDFVGREGTARVPLELFVELLRLKRPADVLSEDQ